ncbi:hypothetical protein FUA23_13575 [Neolewinella aurantiaca]|uniref:Uncharacterized protein n=1 Tax=Neolewinella aurantiaca TaxID=2602767 RepID=A0A5C7FRF2_9BACT|nr:hypothetical protein [Neolewinella aurantiaca]TXF88691.1 hypothetical protein FUA23_13575 [Neolewinella aurantiaca]
MQEKLCPPMKKRQLLGLGLLFTGVGLLVVFSVELEMLSSVPKSRFWKSFGWTLTVPGLLACLYAMIFMKEK